MKTLQEIKEEVAKGVSSLSWKELFSESTRSEAEYLMDKVAIRYARQVITECANNLINSKMGMYDTVMVTCPGCGDEHEFQSKSGECNLRVYILEDCPDDVLQDVNRHSPYECDCGKTFEVDIATRTAVETNHTLL